MAGVQAVEGADREIDRASQARRSPDQVLPGQDPHAWPAGKTASYVQAPSLRRAIATRPPSGEKAP